MEEGGGGGERSTAPLLAAVDRVLADASAPRCAASGGRDAALARWLLAHPPPPCPPDRCARCGGLIDARAANALPVLRSLEPPEPVWLHVRCYPAWHLRRLRAARAALAGAAS